MAVFTSPFDLRSNSAAVASSSLAMVRTMRFARTFSLALDAFMRFWEDHPNYFRLVFMTEETLTPAMTPELTRIPAYRSAVQLGTETIQALIEEVGGDPSKLEEVRDLRMALMVGYLHARLVNRRFPWGSFEALRANASRAIVLGIEACVRKETVTPARRGKSRTPHVRPQA